MANDSNPGAPDGSDAEWTRLALLTSGVGVWDRDIASGRITYSAAWKSMLGYAEHEISDRIEDSYTRVHADDLAQVQATIGAHFDNSTPNYTVEHRIRCKDGSYKWVLSRGRVVSRDEHGKPLRMTGITTDITDTVALSEKLRQNAELLTLLTDEVPGLVYQYRLAADGTGAYTYASAGIATLFGITPAQALADAQALEATIHADDISQFRDSLANSACTLERWSLQFRVVLPDGAERWREVNAGPRRLDDGSTLWHGFIADITAHKLLELQLHDAASTDFLTGLPNRRHVMTRMDQELARIQRSVLARSAVLMFDLDLFKQINDRYGHATGDAVLIQFSAILRHELRKVDSVGRIGGEEFAIVLSDADMGEAELFAQRVRERLARAPMVAAGEPIAVTVSIGIAAMLATDQSIAASLSRADSALYLAKQEGRDRVRIAA